MFFEESSGDDNLGRVRYGQFAAGRDAKKALRAQKVADGDADWFLESAARYHDRTDALIAVALILREENR